MKAEVSKSISDPLGDLISSLMAKCSSSTKGEFFMSKRKLTALSVMIIAISAIYGNKERNTLTNDKYIKIIDELINSIVENKKIDIDIFKIMIEEAEQKKYIIDDYVRQVFEIFAGDKKNLEVIIEGLIVMLILEIGVPESDDSVIRKCAKYFKMDEIEYKNIKEKCLKMGECESLFRLRGILKKEILEMCYCKNFFSNYESDENINL